MIVRQDFTISDHNRLNKFLDFKERNLPNTDFRHKPILVQTDGSYEVSVRSNLKDLVTLESLLESWAIEDKVAHIKSEDSNVVDKFVSFFKS